MIIGGNNNDGVNGGKESAGHARMYEEENGSWIQVYKIANLMRMYSFDQNKRTFYTDWFRDEWCTTLAASMLRENCKNRKLF